MRIELLYFKGCPHHQPAAERVRRVLRKHGIAGEFVEIEVKDDSAVKTHAFPGSPTIRVDGVDIDPRPYGSAPIGLACRRYLGGLPSEEMIQAAVQKAEAK